MDNIILKTLLTSPNFYEKLNLSEVLNEYHFKDSLEIASVIFNGLETKNFVTVAALYKTLPKKLHTQLDSIGKKKALTREVDVLDNVYVLVEKQLKNSFKSVLNKASTEIEESTDIINVLDSIEKKIQDLKESVFPNSEDNEIEIYRQKVKHRRLYGISNYNTGFSAFDDKAPLMEGDLNVICGRFGMGKTSFGLALVNGVNQSGGKGCFITAEMTTNRLLDRQVSYRTGIATKRITKNELDAREQGLQDEAINDIEALGVRYIYETEVLKIIRKIAYLALNKGVKVFFVDYIQILNFIGSGNLSYDLGKISKQFKQLANSLDINITILAQLNRPQKGAEVRRPTNDDIASSDEIARNADNVIHIHRPSYYLDAELQAMEDSETLELAEIIVGKSRDGETALFNMRFVKGQFLEEHYANDNTEFLPTKETVFDSVVYDSKVEPNRSEDIPF
jgi:replicative DNA helicase